MMARNRCIGSGLLSLVLLSSVLPHAAAAQSTAVPQPPLASPQLKPLSLPHLYWHFLVYQNHLDELAATQTAQGKDSSRVRNYLQKKMGLPDADFVAIRKSSGRLTTNVKALDDKAKAIRASGPTATSYGQLKALTDQREAYINAEVTYLRQTLSPAKIKALEAFLTQFFSPANTTPRPPGLSSVQQPAPAAVQQ